MFNVFAKVTGTDKSQEVLKALNELKTMDVLVGIPEETSSEPERINNAELAYIHTHGIRKKKMIEEMEKDMSKGAKYSTAYAMYVQANGSPLWQSPPRPIIEPAIEDAQNNKVIAEELKKAIKEALNGDSIAAKTQLEKAGVIGQNVVRDWFTNPKNGWAPNSQKTIQRKGSENPLIDTGELRKSITYVVRKR